MSRSQFVSQFAEKLTEGSTLKDGLRLRAKYHASQTQPLSAEPARFATVILIVFILIWGMFYLFRFEDPITAFMWPIMFGVWEGMLWIGKDDPPKIIVTLFERHLFWEQLETSRQGKHIS